MVLGKGWVCCSPLRAIGVGLILLSGFGIDSWIFYEIRLVSYCFTWQIASYYQYFHTPRYLPTQAVEFLHGLGEFGQLFRVGSGSSAGGYEIGLTSGRVAHYIGGNEIIGHVVPAFWFPAPPYSQIVNLAPGGIA